MPVCMQCIHRVPGCQSSERFQPIRTSRIIFCAKSPKFAILGDTGWSIARERKNGGIRTQFSNLSSLLARVHWWRHISAVVKWGHLRSFKCGIRLKSSCISLVNTEPHGVQVESLWGKRRGLEVSAEHFSTGQHRTIIWGKKRDLELSVELSGFAVIIIIVFIKVVIKPHSREPAWPSGKALGW